MAGLTVKNTKENIISKIDKNANSDGCWRYPVVVDKDGYTPITFEGKQHFGHRLLYTFLIGDIPAGLTLDHLCRNRFCVNPEHLEPVSNKENILRGVSPSAINARKMYCNLGHRLAGENLKVRKNHRLCRICWRRQKRKDYYRQAKKFMPADVDWLELAA